MDASPHSPTGPNGTTKFPSFSDSFPDYQDSGFPRRSSSGVRDYSPGHSTAAEDSGTGGANRWLPRAASRSQWSGARNSMFAGSSPARHEVRHGRQKSLSEAIRTIRNNRSGSVSQNAHELADALKAPVSPRLVILCCIWYTVSVISNTSAGVILTTFPKPVTLTIIQFGCIVVWCLFVSFLADKYPGLKTRIPALRMGIRPPSRELIMTTLPITGFMIGGHILTSDAMSRIPVSLVHTMKGLSPLITVLAYRFIFKVHYNWPTYASLVPLTIGVVMACSTKFSDNVLGLLSAFLSAILFVTQNIVSKQLFEDAAKTEQEGFRRTHRPDKLNLLCYSSLLALCFTFPIWFWSEGWGIISDFWTHGSVTLSSKKDALDHGRLLFEYLFNGTFHFLQSFVAFQLLSEISPVTYSVASLIKRVAVICVAILWFGNAITRVQALGIALTFLGLYLYDRTSDSGKAEKRSRVLQQQLHSSRHDLLPLAERSGSPGSGHLPSRPPLQTLASGYETVFHPAGGMNGTPHHVPADAKKHDDIGPGRPEARGEGAPAGMNGWLPAGTKAEDTWQARDVSPGTALPVS